MSQPSWMHTYQMELVLCFMEVFFVEKQMRTWALEFICVENIHTRIKEFEVTENFLLLISSLWIFFLSHKHNSECTVSDS